jgi:hypothetical protein
MRWEDKAKMEFGEISEDGRWMQLAQDCIQLTGFGITEFKS